MGKCAIYPGSFDPITYGHIDIIMRAAKLFSNIVVAIGGNPEKKPLFSQRERVALVKQAIIELDLPNVTVAKFSGLLAKYAQDAGAVAIIRGLRAVSDFEHEFQMALANRRLFPDAETVFLMPSEQFVYLSSSMVKIIALNGGDVSLFVPHAVEKALLKKIGGKK